jgi:glycosyltransferase involved in cell wall biosynthesis
LILSSRSCLTVRGSLFILSERTKLKTIEKCRVNILFAIRYFYPFVGGTEKQALTLASSFIKKGVQVRIITSRFERKWPKREIIDDVEVVRLFSPRIKVLGAVIFLSCLAGYLIKNRKDISLIHTYQIGYTSSLSIFLGILLRKPSLIKLASSGEGGDIERARKTLWGRIFLYMAKKASRIIIVSRTVEEELIAASVDHAKLCPISNGVDLNEYNHREEQSQARKALEIPDRKTIIYTGRLSPEKGVDFLVRSFARVQRSLNCQLVIIADGPEKKYIMHLIDRFEVSDAVLLIPTVDDVASYLKAADLFILPSRFEGLSNALLEAMACSVPIISTRVGGSIDLIKDGINGILVDSESEEQLVDAIVRVFTDPELASSLGENARKSIEVHHDLNQVSDAYLELYRNLYSSYYN